MGEKMKWSEAEAVVRAYRAQHGASDVVDVDSLAQALGTDVDEIHHLAAGRRRFVDRSGVLSAGLAFVAALGALALARPALTTSRTIPTAPPAEVTRIVLFTGDTDLDAIPPTPPIPDRIDRLPDDPL